MGDDAATIGQGRPVTMPPDAVEMLEIGGPVFGVIRVVPELDRHGGERFQAAQLALPAADGPAFIIQNLYRHAKAAGLDFAGMHRLCRRAKHKAGNQVRAAGNRTELKRRADLVIDEFKRLRRQR